MKLHDITKQIRAFADQLESTQPPAPVDPYAELKAAHAAGKVIQFKPSGFSSWHEHDDPDWTAPLICYRIKPDAPPFQLPPPPPGMQWHRTDGWKTEDLPPGTRPHVLGEEDYPEDSERRAAGWRSCIRQKYGTTDKDFHRRTTRPLVFEHEGKQWTYHRPGDPMPCGEQERVTVLYNDPVQEFRGAPCPANCFAWKNPSGNTPILGWRYAEPLTREVELGPEDVPPCSAVKGPSDGDNEYALVSGVGKRGIILSDGRVIAFSHMRSGWLLNRPHHRDPSGNPTLWEPCHKTIPQNG